MPIKQFIEPLRTIIPDGFFRRSSKLQCGLVVAEFSK